ncbi:hypothetical protein [Mesoflavibacter sp. SCSIO 43206]|uniref:hypothetical protein n=1 Tax=Mesoflavibacter sp. SCSIO 43206 TaxID=2779362 RepID=UPI001CA9B5FA|nr:hypothetical protein [Mesoflavibacter sp. SCSIO 43206]UAB74422.1 hypothetical protein INR78_08425 [Mesoflavibacter sp. SCSIO 43206]
MKFSKILFIFAVLFSTSLSAQNQLNNYKYIVVPNQFKFQKEPGQYRVNGLTKFLLEKQNFTVLLEGDTLPEDAIQNNCLVLKTTAIDDSSMFKTKLKFQFKDCQGKVVYTTEEGESREKKYIVAYNEAVRQAFSSLSNFTHKYEVKETENEAEEVIVTPLPKVTEAPLVKEVDEEEIDEEIEIPIKEGYKNSSNNALTAEAFGVINYNLKNSQGQTVYTILYSGKEDLYIVKGKDAVIYKINGSWVIATNDNGTLQIKSIDIKF